MTRNPDTWTPDLVESWLVDAVRWCNGAGGLAGPGGYRTSLPTPHFTLGDRLEEGWDPEEVDDEATVKVALGPEEADRMNAALNWVGDMITAAGLPVMANAVNAQVEHKATRRPAKVAYARRGLNHSTGPRLAQKGLVRISVELDRKGEPVWPKRS
jgi:hypothetical protein